jgi:hypothetical protein
VCYISPIPIDGRARVLGMEFGVGDLLLRYDYFLFCLNKQTNRISSSCCGTDVALDSSFFCHFDQKLSHRSLHDHVFWDYF